MTVDAGSCVRTTVNVMRKSIMMNTTVNRMRKSSEVKAMSKIKMIRIMMNNMRIFTMSRKIVMRTMRAIVMTRMTGVVDVTHTAVT